MGYGDGRFRKYVATVDMQIQWTGETSQIFGPITLNIRDGGDRDFEILPQAKQTSNGRVLIYAKAGNQDMAQVRFVLL